MSVTWTHAGATVGMHGPANSGRFSHYAWMGTHPDASAPVTGGMLAGLVVLLSLRSGSGSTGLRF